VRDWAPGDLVVVLASSLVDRCGSEAQLFTRGLQLGLVIQRSHQWVEPNALQEESHMYYVIFFASIAGTPPGLDDDVMSPGFYRVPGNRIIHPDEASNPARLFGSQRLQE